MTEAQRDTQARPGAARAAGASVSARFERLVSMIDEQRCVVLDGAVGTELPRLARGAAHGVDERLWGTRALIDTPDAVAEVHRRYVETGEGLLKQRYGPQWKEPPDEFDALWSREEGGR
jgi:S-methylmethionine-dependent homocysteine/selenocysteine methylase